MNLRESVIILCMGLLLTTCSGEKTDQELLDEDLSVLNEALKRDKVLVYKLLKVTVRDHYTQKSDIPSTNTLSKAVRYSLNQINEGSSDVDISWTDWLKAYREYQSLKSYAISVDEDQFPTLLENLIAIYTDQPLQSGEEGTMLPGWTSDKEHSVLSFLTLPTKSLGKEIALYEASKTRTETLADDSWKAGFLTQRGILYSLEGLYYLSERELTESIAWLEDHPNAAFPFIRVLYKDRLLLAKDTWLGVHAANHLYRGIDRMMMEREKDNERALDDFEVFLVDCNELGWNDELVWIIQTYVGLKKQDREQAIAGLQQLKTSTIFGHSEQKSIDEAIAYLNKKDPDGALTGVYDKVFMAKLVTKYVFYKLSEIDWEKVLKENNVPQADKIIAFNQFINEQGKTLNKLTSVDQLKEKGKAWYDKAKDIVQ
ncbi:MAG: hypothetical protein AAGA66_14720 [Bacteroidota bacterium]